jgi:hypothetical protein
MSHVAVAMSLLGLVLIVSTGHAESPYLDPLRPTGFSLHAVGLPPRAIGSTILRAQGTLAVAVQVTVEDYVPRGLEPTLLMDGVPILVASGVTGVHGRVTTLSFLVERPGLLKDGAILGLQLGEDPKTRTQIPGVLRRDTIQAPDPDEARRLGLPSLAEWLNRPASP